ncbi:MAG: glycosyl transferase family 39 [Mycobacterium sp.]|nr:glycosyl transferase family 39 [Mycobacterium sp.]
MVDDGRSVSPFAARGVLGIAGVVALLHCVAMAFGTSYWFDEVYMLAIGRYHLDWGSADQPPLAPALAALADAIAPGSVIALRLPAVLATAGAVVVAGLIARELGCDSRAQVFTAAAQATGLWQNLVGHWLTPYTLEPLQWMLLVWLLIRWQRVRDDRLLLVLGAVIGIAAMTKFQVMLLCLVLLVAVAIRGPRDLLRRPLFWAGAVLAALIAAPTLIWQHLHGWPQLRMTPVVAGEAEALYGGRPGISVQLLVFAGLAGLVLGSYGLFRLLRADEMRPYRYLGMTFVVLYVVFVATAGRPYYLAGLYAPLVAAFALGLQRRREADRAPRRWLVWPAWLAATAVAVGLLVTSVSIARSDVAENIARRTADVYHGLPAAQRDRTVIVGESYITAAFIDGYSQRYALPQAYSPNRSYGYFPPPPADHDVVLYVGNDPGALHGYFTDAHQVADIDDDMHAYLLTGQRQSWESIGPQVRTLTVS